METYRTTILEPPLWPATSHGLRPGALPHERLVCYLRPLGRISTDPWPDYSICEQIFCKFQHAFAGPTILDSPNHDQAGSSKTDQPIETIAAHSLEMCHSESSEVQTERMRTPQCCTAPRSRLSSPCPLTREGMQAMPFRTAFRR